jgi:hypothetical protein
VISIRKLAESSAYDLLFENGQMTQVDECKNRAWLKAGISWRVGNLFWRSGKSHKQEAATNHINGQQPDNIHSDWSFAAKKVFKVKKLISIYLPRGK